MPHFHKFTILIRFVIPVLSGCFLRLHGEIQANRKGAEDELCAFGILRCFVVYAPAGLGSFLIELGDLDLFGEAEFGETQMQ